MGTTHLGPLDEVRPVIRSALTIVGSLLIEANDVMARKGKNFEAWSNHDGDTDFSTVYNLPLADIQEVYEDLYTISEKMHAALIPLINISLNLKLFDSDGDKWNPYSNVILGIEDALIYSLDMQDLVRIMHCRLGNKPCLPLPDDTFKIMVEISKKNTSSEIRKTLVVRMLEFLQVDYEDLNFFEGNEELPRSAAMESLRTHASWSIEPLYKVRNHTNIEWQLFELLVATGVRRDWLEADMERIANKCDGSWPTDPENIPGHSDAGKCFVCLCSFTAEDRPLKFRCGHVIGSECLKMWAEKQKNPACPMCGKACLTLANRIPLPTRSFYRELLELDKMLALLDD